MAPLSATQQKYLAIAWACFDQEPKIDYERFKELAGLASAHSARELMRVTKKKLREEYGLDSATPASKSAGRIQTPASSSVKKNSSNSSGTGKGTSAGTQGRKRKVQPAVATSIEQRDEEREDVAAGLATPTPSRDKTPAAKKLKKEEPVDDTQSTLNFADDFDDYYEREMEGQSGYF